MHNAGDLVMCLGDFNARGGRYIDGLIVGMVWVREILKEECYWFCLVKELCVSNTWFKRV